MTPSEARALAAAEVVFWVGPVLTPWLDRAIEDLVCPMRSRSRLMSTSDGVANPSVSQRRACLTRMTTMGISMATTMHER